MFGGLKKKVCSNCNKEISVNNFDKHFKSCIRPKKPKKILGVDWDPNRGFKDGSRVIWNKGLTKYNNDGILKQSQTMKQKYKDGLVSVQGAAAWSLEERSENAKQRGLGGYNPNAGRSKKYWVNDSFGRKVCLQSSYELKCVEILDSLNIKWIRPTYLMYTVDNKLKKYFPDFFLVEHNIYLDPKNNFLAKKDFNKIKSVQEENNVIVYVLTEDINTVDYIKKHVLLNAPWSNG